MNKKGFTVVELVASLALVSIILVFLFQVIIQLKDLFTFDNTKTEILRENAMVADALNSWLDSNSILSANKSGNTISFMRSDGTSTNLVINEKKINFNNKDYQYDGKITFEKGSVEYINTTTGILYLNLNIKDDDDNEYPFDYMHDFKRAAISSSFNTNFSFDFTDSKQVFTVPYTGNYKLEAWGAEGNSIFDGISGKGGYAVGTVHLEASQKIYIYVGGHNGFNGGLKGSSTPGGGATSIMSTDRGELKNYESYKNEVLIVAGGGGSAERVTGGSGGGFQGADGNGTYGGITSNGKGGSQTSGGSKGSNTIATGETSGSFGQGGSGNSNTDSGPSGGGGFYGGGGITYAGGAGGGSGYIGNSLLANKHMTGYNVLTSNDTNIKTLSTTCLDSDPKVDCAKSGNGFVRITYVSEGDNSDLPTPTFSSDANDVIIAYPDGCGSKYTCTYQKNNDPMQTVESMSAKVTFDAAGTIIAKITDGKQTSTSTYHHAYIKNILSDVTLKTDPSTTDNLTYNNGVYHIDRTTNFGGIQIPYTLFEEEKNYLLTYKVKKVSGTLKNIRGHSFSQEKNQRFYINDKLQNTMYVSEDDNVSDTTDVYTIKLYFTYHEDTSVQPDKNLYIQPNRGKAEKYNVTCDIYDVAIYKLN